MAVAKTAPLSSTPQFSSARFLSQRNVDTLRFDWETLVLGTTRNSIHYCHTLRERSYTHTHMDVLWECAVLRVGRCPPGFAPLWGNVPHRPQK